ncbi:MAG: hypothetical protein AAB790_01095 [Patescibacteria group bacterium]
MIEIIPTNTCPPDIAEMTKRSGFFAGFAEWIQLDISDGAFTSERSWPFHEGQWEEIESMAAGALELPSAPPLKYETHLMVEEPRELGMRLAEAGIARIIGHVEAFGDDKEILSALDSWRSAGAQEVGLALLLDTPLPVLEPMIGACDVVQVMSIATLGAQGAPYDVRAVARIKELHTKYPALAISVDGGVSLKNIADLARAGATRFGVGSAITKAPDPKAAYEKLKATAENALDPVR